MTLFTEARNISLILHLGPETGWRLTSRREAKVIQCVSTLMRTVNEMVMTKRKRRKSGNVMSSVKYVGALTQNLREEMSLSYIFDKKAEKKRSSFGQTSKSNNLSA